MLPVHPREEIVVAFYNRLWLKCSFFNEDWHSRIGSCSLKSSFPLPLVVSKSDLLILLAKSISFSYFWKKKFKKTKQLVLYCESHAQRFTKFFHFHPCKFIEIYMTVCWADSQISGTEGAARNTYYRVVQLEACGYVWLATG